MICYGSSVSLGADIPFNARDWRNCQEIFRWCRQYTLINAAEHTDWLKKIQLDPKNRMFSVDVLDIGSVGVCGLTNVDWVAQHAEFSLYIAPKYQGNSYGKLALYTLCMHGFKDLNLQKIWGETFEENPAMHMFEQLGFEKNPGHKKHYYKNGKLIDTYFYNLFKKDFLEKNYDKVLSR